MNTQTVDQTARGAAPGPVPGTRITEAYARMLARDAYFWAWPMANIYNKRLTLGKAPAVAGYDCAASSAPLTHKST